MLWAARTVTRSLSTSARDDSDSHLQADLSSPWTSVSPNCFLRIICLASAAAASAHTSAATCDTATWEVVAACAMRRAKGANKSGGQARLGLVQDHQGRRPRPTAARQQQRQSIMGRVACQDAMTWSVGPTLPPPQPVA